MPCISTSGSLNVSGTVSIWGTNKTSLYLCMELRMVKSDNISTYSVSDPTCALIRDGNGSIGQSYGSVLYGDYVIHAWFTTPTYWDGGDSARAHVYSS
ncbi:hypothetical protein [Streptomyces sp. NK08204]|uniref:hypothetical protein n=1 Tax=Streptomyces sp. NK08204 TaxID=2873260 RepID=UPI001CEDEB12|nr:hypothetical protein [Streptomyces sp. NK08204]